MTVAVPCFAAVGFLRPLAPPWRGKSIRSPGAKCKHAEHPGSWPRGASSRCGPGGRLPATSEAPKLSGARRAGVLVPLGAGQERKKAGRPGAAPGSVRCPGRRGDGAGRNHAAPMGPRGASPVVGICASGRAFCPHTPVSPAGRSFCVLSREAAAGQALSSTAVTAADGGCRGGARSVSPSLGTSAAWRKQQREPHVSARDATGRATHGEGSGRGVFTVHVIRPATSKTRTLLFTSSFHVSRIRLVSGTRRSSWLLSRVAPGLGETLEEPGATCAWIPAEVPCHEPLAPPGPLGPEERRGGGSSAHTQSWRPQTSNPSFFFFFNHILFCFVLFCFRAGN